VKRVLLLGGLAAAASAYWFQRRAKDELEPEPEVVFEPAPEPPPFADERGAVPGQGERERESQATQETRYERLVDEESEQRREAAERLQDDPLTRRLEDY
jgi:hypothetical protein